jgi:ubiquinone/menaquinone biosynthesis C-methylase UbiE
MTHAAYEPPTLEVSLTLGLGLTVLNPYYRDFARSLELSGSERVLDFGSGSGICTRHIAAILERGGGRLDCVDISSGWMQVIRQTLRRYKNLSYHLGQINDLNLPEGAFDAVVVHFVLHDIPASDRDVVVTALARKLKPGGRLIIREPHDRGLALSDLNALAAKAGMTTDVLETRNVFIGHVLDGRFVRESA